MAIVQKEVPVAAPVRTGLDVRAWGMDTAGKPFTQSAQTTEISSKGARLRGLSHVQPGDLIGIQYHENKARFRVVWVGAAVGGDAGAVGVECIEAEKCLWAKELEERAVPPAVFVAANPPGIAPAPDAGLAGEWPARDRRRFPRFPCFGVLRIKEIGSDFQTPQRLTDIGLGGCYGESMSALPYGASVEMVLEVCGEQVPAFGMVRTSHPAMGNGIGFTDMPAESWKKLARVIRQLGGEEIPLAAAAPPQIGEAVEALLSLLQKKGITITREEFLQELGIRKAG
jgi:hypothetical protein